MLTYQRLLVWLPSLYICPCMLPGLLKHVLVLNNKYKVLEIWKKEIIFPHRNYSNYNRCRLLIRHLILPSLFLITPYKGFSLISVLFNLISNYNLIWTFPTLWSEWVIWRSSSHNAVASSGNACMLSSTMYDIQLFYSLNQVKIRTIAWAV